MTGHRHHRTQLGLASVVAVGTLAALAACGSGGTEATPVAQSGAEWTTVHGDADTGGQYGAVVATDATTVVALGGTDADNSDQGETRIDRWDGSRWTSDTPPDGSTMQPSMADASGPDDIWAAGRTPDGTLGTLHYDGERWSASQTDAGSDVRDIEAVATGDAWLIGLGDDSGTTAKRFDGTSWKDAPSPEHSESALDSLASDEMYAAGSSDDQPTVERWDGTQWASMDVPQVDLGEGCAYAGFADIFARSSADVWASGSVTCMEPNENEYEKPLLAHWDGTRWDVTIGKERGAYTQVADDGEKGVWLADYGSGSRAHVHRTADGATTRHDISKDGYDLQNPTLENLPGTSSMVGTASLYEEGDPDQPRNYGIVMGYDLG